MSTLKQLQGEIAGRMRRGDSFTAVEDEVIDTSALPDAEKRLSPRASVQATARAAGPATQADGPRRNDAGPDEIGEPTMAHPPHAAPGV